MRAQNTYTLQKSLRTASENNPFLRTRQYNIGIAEADIVTARLRPNPILNNQTLQLVQPALFPANTEWHNGHNRQVWWQLTKPFQMPALRRNKIAYAYQNSILSQKVFNEFKRNLFQDVALKWLDVWTARKLLDILQLAKTNTDSLVSINKLRFRNQVITEIDLSRTELLADQLALQIKSAEQNYRNELLNLKFLLGVTDEINIDTTDNFSFAFPANIDTVLQQALNNRSDVTAIKSGIDVANANIKLQRSYAWPTPELGLIYNPQNTIPYIGFFGTIQVPVFARNQGERKKSYILKQQAEQNMSAIQMQIQTELTTAFNSYQTQKQNLLYFGSMLTKAQNILMSVKYSYLRGGTTIIDFLEAQRSWSDTQQQYYGTLQLYRQSYIKLLYASGIINQMAQ